MIVYLSCPICHEPAAIEVEVDNEDVVYPPTCPSCGAVIGDEEQEKIAANVQQEVLGHMIDMIYDRQKDKDIHNDM